jgi:geranylgeranyl diphosphate synthase, type I
VSGSWAGGNVLPAGETATAAERQSRALDEVRGPVDATLDRFLTERLAEIGSLDPALVPVCEEIGSFVRAGGKRLRPAFVYWGHRATGADHDDGIFTAAAAVELLHTFALIHDDVMDRGLRRRGRPTVHQALADHHRAEGLAGDPAWFGVGAGILAGDLVFALADELLDRSPLPPAAMARARKVFATLRTEVTAGQYLDLRLAGQLDAGEEKALQVALLKSGRYTATRPLELGAAVAPGEASASVQTALVHYGDAVGVAFQLRDDVLGLFGDPARTGKSVIDDLREGKRTVLVLRALAVADQAGRRALQDALGRSDLDDRGAARAREVVVDSGALAAVERLLAAYQDQARQAASTLPSPAQDALLALADLAGSRVA